MGASGTSRSMTTTGILRMRRAAASLRLVARGHQEDAVDLFLDEQVHVEQLAGGVAVRVAENGAVAGGEAGVFDAAADLGKEGVGAVGDDQAESVGAFAAQAAGDGVGLEAQLGHGAFDARFSSALTGRESLITWETVVEETPARIATSWIVTMGGRSCSQTIAQTIASSIARANGRGVNRFEVAETVGLSPRG